MKICVVGLGLMGSSLAKRLVSKGFDVVLYNRTIEKAKSLASELGVEYVEKPYRCVEKCGIVAIFVSDDEALMNVLLPPNGMTLTGCRGVYIVNMSTVTITASEMAKNIVESCGGRYVEAPVWGSVSEVLNGELVVFLGGDERALEDLRDFLNAISKKIIYVGPVPKAMALKLAINQINHTIAANLAEALAFIIASGIEVEKLYEATRGSWMEPIVDRFIDRMIEQKSLRFRLELAAKDLECFIQSARKLRLSVIASAAAAQRFMEATMNGYGDRDYTQIGRYLIDSIQKHSKQTH